MITVVLNGAARLLPARSPLTDLVPWRPGTAAAVNGIVVPAGAWSATVLCDGDTVEVLTAVQGG